MSTRFNQRCLDILHSRSVKEFSRNVADAVQSLGMTTVGVSVITEHSPGMTEFRTMTNAPEGYVSDFEDLELAKLDPVSQHCKHSSEPIVWDQKLYAMDGSRLASAELDALQWSIDGLTDAEVGEKMNISATEALLRLRRAMAKLGCASKYEAGLRAIRLGLISCD